MDWITHVQYSSYTQRIMTRDLNITFLPEDLLPSASLIHDQLLSFSPDYNNKQWPQPWVRQLCCLTIHLPVWSDTFTTCLFTVLQTIFFKVFSFHILNLSWKVLIKLPCRDVAINISKNNILLALYVIYSITPDSELIKV